MMSTSTIGIGVGKVDRAFKLNRAAAVEFEAVDHPFLTLQARTQYAVVQNQAWV